MLFNVYTGDGNDGTTFDHEIEAPSMDGAVNAYMAGVAPHKRDLFVEEGEEDATFLVVYEDEDGSTAYNGGAYFIVEIRAAATDPRRSPAAV